MVRKLGTEAAGSDQSEVTKPKAPSCSPPCLLLEQTIAPSSPWRPRPESQPQRHLTWRCAIGKCGGWSGAKRRCGADAAWGRRSRVAAEGLQLSFSCAQ